MATATMTIIDDGDEHVTVTVESDPAIPMKDGLPDTDQLTSAQAALIGASMSLAKQMAKGEVNVQDAETGELERVGTFTRVEAGEEIPAGLGDTLLSWATAISAEVSFGRSKDCWLLHAVFGQEAPDSPMAGGAVNSVGDTLTECIESGLAQAGVNVCGNLVGDENDVMVPCGWTGACGECHS